MNRADWIWARIKEVGHQGSILVAVSMLVKLFTWAAGILMRFYYRVYPPLGKPKENDYSNSNDFADACV